MLITEDGEQDEILGIYRVLRALALSIRVACFETSGLRLRVPSEAEHPARCFADPKTVHRLKSRVRSRTWRRLADPVWVDWPADDMHQALQHSTLKPSVSAESAVQLAWVQVVGELCP